MKKIQLLFICFIMVMGCFSYSYAVSFEFYGYDMGGVASAEMDISISDSTVYLTLDNTSPVTYYDSASSTYKTNTPCITGFGFNLLNNPNPDNDVFNWTLTAFTVGSDSYETTVGGNLFSGSNKWEMLTAQKTQGIHYFFDYLPEISGTDGALYNPEIVNPPAGNGNHASIPYYTQAVLTMTFNYVPELAIVYDSSTYVRMQKVGNGGSVKMYGTPEPGTMFLLGSLATGLFGLAGLRRRFSK